MVEAPLVKSVMMFGGPLMLKIRCSDVSFKVSPLSIARVERVLDDLNVQCTLLAISLIPSAP